MTKPPIGNYLPPAPAFYTGQGQVIVTHANLPHWNKQKIAYFITFRLADSLPAEKLAQLEAEREAWLLAHPQPWDEATQVEYFDKFANTINKWLDNGHGSCVLRESANREIVENALWHFADERYALYAYVVMPNHVHVLFMPQDDYDAKDIVASWKRFTARQIHRQNGKEGEALWQKESFDTLIRNERHFHRVVRYIRENDLAISWSYDMKG